MSDVEVGATCRIGKGKTVWEIVSIERANWLHLSALGKGGFVNRTAKLEDINDVHAQQLEVPLCAVVSERARARDAAHALHDQLRFSAPDRIQDLAQKAFSAADSYAHACLLHSNSLAALGIEEEA